MKDLTKVMAAFETLREGGFQAEANFACCQVCGHYELRQRCDAIERSLGVRPHGVRPHGYCFWHDQDQERIDEGGDELMIRFDAELTAKAACEAFAMHDVKHTWTGDVGRCIEVTL